MDKKNDMKEKQHIRLATVENRSVWLSPEGKFYDGDAHENRAKEILAGLYGIKAGSDAGDTLEKLGWIRLESNLMWEIRINDGYFEERTITQSQLDSLYEWCTVHKKLYPAVHIK